MMQTRRGRGLAMAMMVAGMSMSPASAHHSTTMFDHAKAVTIKGTVVELRWVNPHVSLLVKGTLEGDVNSEEWLLEMTSPGNLVRAGGWTRNALKPGDVVVIDFSPLRDPSRRGGALKKVTISASGQTLTANILAQEMPGLE